MKIRKDYISYSPPFLGDTEIQSVIDTLRSDWLSRGPKVSQFESLFQQHVGAEAALAVNSCTSALHTALVAGEIGPGDEVITTVNTFASTVNVIEHVGARPVLVDIDYDTMNFDLAKVEQAITPQTKAIIGVHFGGHPFDIDGLKAIIGDRQILLIEDAAHGLGASFKNKPVGSGKNPAAFSFYATKNLTTGEGGMLTGSSSFIESAKIIALHGMTKDAWKRYEKGGSWQYDIVLPGFKYNMTDIQASLGIGQLSRFDSFQKRRREIVSQYQESFGDLRNAIDSPIERPNCTHAWHLYVIRVREESKIGREQVIDELHKRNIGTSVHFIPIHQHSFYKRKYGWTDRDFPVACKSFKGALSLPLNPRLSDEQVQYITEAVKEVLER